MISKFALLSLVCISSCGDIEDPGPAHLNLPERKSIVARWNIENIKNAPLQIVLSDSFAELFEKEHEDKNGFNPIEQMADNWNNAHPVLDFFSLPFRWREEKNYERLRDFQDDEMGIYLSKDWYNNLSRSALGITQFFGVKRNRGTDKEYIELVHADIILNYRDHEFSLTGEEDKYDLYTIILHEMGHMIGVPHPIGLGDRDAVMAPSLGRGELKRMLLDPDIEELLKSYPISNSKYLYDIPDQTAPFNLLREADPERFIIELMVDGHKHFHHNGKFISCDKKIH